MKLELRTRDGKALLFVIALLIVLIISSAVMAIITLSFGWIMLWIVFAILGTMVARTTILFILEGDIDG